MNQQTQTEKTSRPLLAGRTALITGGAKRIGRQTALTLARHGADIIITWNHSRDAAYKVCQAATATGVRADALSADLSDPAQAQELFQRIPKESGPVDILVNNASVFTPSELDDIADPELAATFTLNSFSPAIIAHGFSKQTETGDIINMLDTRITGIDLAHVAYDLSKKLLFSLTETMAAAYAPALRVNAIAPGFILPPSRESLPEEKQHAPKLLIDCDDRMRELMKAVLFFLSNRFVTGQVLYVDGGEHVKRKVN